jgi:hypothetical protein
LRAALFPELDNNGFTRNAEKRPSMARNLFQHLFQRAGPAQINSNFSNDAPWRRAAAARLAYN